MKTDRDKWIRESTSREVTLTDRELATVLASLRYFQNGIGSFDLLDDFTRPDQFPHFDEVTPLTIDEIDQLCERLNMGRLIGE